MELRSGKGLLKTFENFKTALFTGDRQKLDQIIAIDYRGYTIYGTIEDREAILNVYGNSLLQLEKYDVHDIRVEVIGEVGIISGQGYIRCKYDGVLFEHRVRFLDIYRFRGSDWQLYLTQITEIQQI